MSHPKAKSFLINFLVTLIGYLLVSGASLSGMHDTDLYLMFMWVVPVVGTLVAMLVVNVHFLEFPFTANALAGLAILVLYGIGCHLVAPPGTEIRGILLFVALVAFLPGVISALLAGLIGKWLEEYRWRHCVA